MLSPRGPEECPVWSGCEWIYRRFEPSSQGSIVLLEVRTEGGERKRSQAKGVDCKWSKRIWNVGVPT